MQTPAVASPPPAAAAAATSTDAVVGAAPPSADPNPLVTHGTKLVTPAPAPELRPRVLTMWQRFNRVVRPPRPDNAHLIFESEVLSNVYLVKVSETLKL